MIIDKRRYDLIYWGVWVALLLLMLFLVGLGQPIIVFAQDPTPTLHPTPTPHPTPVVEVYSAASVLTESATMTDMNDAIAGIGHPAIWGMSPITCTPGNEASNCTFAGDFYEFEPVISDTGDITDTEPITYAGMWSYSVEGYRNGSQVLASGTIEDYGCTGWVEWSGGVNSSSYRWPVISFQAEGPDSAGYNWPVEMYWWSVNPTNDCNFGDAKFDIYGQGSVNAAWSYIEGNDWEGSFADIWDDDDDWKYGDGVEGSVQFNCDMGYFEWDQRINFCVGGALPDPVDGVDPVTQTITMTNQYLLDTSVCTIGIGIKGAAFVDDLGGDYDLPVRMLPEPRSGYVMTTYNEYRVDGIAYHLFYGGTPISPTSGLASWDFEYQGHIWDQLPGGWGQAGTPVDVSEYPFAFSREVCCVDASGHCMDVLDDRSDLGDDFDGFLDIENGLKFCIDMPLVFFRNLYTHVKNVFDTTVNWLSFITGFDGQLPYVPEVDDVELCFQAKIYTFKHPIDFLNRVGLTLMWIVVGAILMALVKELAA